LKFSNNQLQYGTGINMVGSPMNVGLMMEDEGLNLNGLYPNSPMSMK
jgi:hypothetical protein